AMIGLTAFLLLLGGIKNEYSSFSILLLNGFSQKINEISKPAPWGRKIDWKEQIEKYFLLTVHILVFTLAVLQLYYYELTDYLVCLYIIY
ncbi:hypothetical protein, partial [Bacillus sp. SIMBA_005]|uniref:hypothetical protein n=1 Tax=Bacillus sp. SIMBA_005 TaxID=3085754 RepID=UPI00397831F3